jgi:hypothetical protein
MPEGVRPGLLVPGQQQSSCLVMPVSCDYRIHAVRSIGYASFVKQACFHRSWTLPGKDAIKEYNAEYIMEMKKINAGKLRAIGYDARERILRVEFEDGTAIDYAGVGTEVWRKLSTSGSAWSYYRDNIEEEFTGRRGTVPAEAKARQQLEDLFKVPGDESKG